MNRHAEGHPFAGFGRTEAAVCASPKAVDLPTQIYRVERRRRRLSNADLGAMFGVSGHLRAAWAREGILRRHSDLDELDAVELAIFARMVRAIGKRTARRAWAKMRPHIQSWATQRSSVPAWMVVDIRGDSHAFACSPRQLAQVAASERPVVVFSLSACVREARARFAEATVEDAPMGAAE